MYREEVPGSWKQQYALWWLSSRKCTGKCSLFHIRKERPAVEVVLASPQSLRSEVEQARPHLIIAAEVPSELKEMDTLFWVELSAEDGLVATIRADGYSDTIHDVSLQELLAVVDKTQEEVLAHDDG
jgi:hypothetical protein